MTNSNPKARQVLDRIAEKNRTPKALKGLPENHMVPAFKVNGRAVASVLISRLSAAGIESQAKHHRLWTEVSVRPRDLEKTLQLKSDLLKNLPDERPTMSRDYDVFFLFTPFLLLAAVMSLFLGQYCFVGVITTGFSAMLVFERIQRQLRYQAASKIRLSELFLLTALCAVNVAVWIATLYPSECFQNDG